MTPADPVRAAAEAYADATDRGEKWGSLVGAFIAGADWRSDNPGQDEITDAVERMLAHEQGGGDGWWQGWEMLKAAYAKALPS